MSMRVVNIAIALGVLLAGWLLARMANGGRALRFVGSAAKVTALLVAVWFVSAAWIGSPLRPAAPSGPFVLDYAAECAFFAALVLLPLGWVMSVLRLGIPQFRNGAVGPAAIQCAALTACTGLLVAQFVHSPFIEEGRTPEKRNAVLQSSLRAIADGDNVAPRDRWDPDYVVSTVGRDPKALFRWVQQNTFWIPYRGALRGPVGVLNDRQGNSFDRALLLSTLLEKAGFNVRIAHGEIKSDEAVAMLPQLIAERAAEFADLPAEVEPLRGIHEAALQYHLDPDGIERSIAEQESRMDRIAQEIDIRVEQQTKYLLQSIQRSGKDADWKHRFESAVAMLQDHWWVQVQDASRWVDLDLLVGDGTRSVALSAAKVTYAVPQLAPDLYHQIVIRVIAEHWAAGATKERNALEYAIRTADVVGQPIKLQFVPSHWLSGTEAQSQVVPDIRGSALKMNEWAAGLVVGDKTVASAVLHDTGDEQDAPKGGLFSLGAALDSTMNQGRHAASPTHFLTAVWIEYEVRVPGDKPWKIRRSVFDLIGPAARATGVPQFELDDTKKLTRSLALVMKTEILPQVCQFAPEFVAHLTSAPIAANQKLLGALIEPDFSLDSDEAKEMLSQAVPPASPLVGLAYMRLEWNHAHRNVFIDQPNILSRHQYLRYTPSRIAYDDAIDIVNNEVGVSLATPDAFAARLQQGVRDTNNEALLFGGGGIGNTGDAYSESHDWLAITSADRRTLNQLKFPADTLQRITEDLATDLLVVVPHGPIQRRNEEFVGWWRIDATTGSALGVGANGWGQDLAEESLSERAAAEWFKAFFWENGLCHVYGQTLNAILVYKEILVGESRPSWTAEGPKSKDPAEIVRENARVCLITGMVAGYLATLPLLLITLKNVKVFRRLRESEEWLEKPRPPAREPCLASEQSPFTSTIPLASSLMIPAFAMFVGGTLPCIPSNGRGLDATTKDGLRGHTPPGPAPKNPTYNDPNMELKVKDTQPNLSSKGIPKPPLELPTLEELNQAELEYRKAYKDSADALSDWLRYKDPDYGHDIAPQKLDDLWNTFKALEKESDILQARYEKMQKLYDYFGPGQGPQPGANQAVGSAGAGNALKGGGS